MSIDDADPTVVKLIDIGVASGKQAAGLYVGSDKTTIRFFATLNDGPSYSFGIEAPKISPAPTGPSDGLSGQVFA